MYVPRGHGGGGAADVSLQRDVQSRAAGHPGLRRPKRDRQGSAAADAAGIGAWGRPLAVLGFEPSLRGCVRDDTPVDADHAVTFSAAEGGVLCERCAAERPEAAQTRLAARDYRDLLVLNDPTAP